VKAQILGVVTETGRLPCSCAETSFQPTGLSFGKTNLDGRKLEAIKSKNYYRCNFAEVQPING